MLSIHFIRENIDLVKQNCANRRMLVDIDALIALHDKTREISLAIDNLRAERNKNSATKPTPEEIMRLKQVGDQIATLEKEFTVANARLHELWMQVPNMSHPETPIRGEEDFKILAPGTKPHFDFEPKDHEQLMIDLDVIDFERGAKVTGSKFYFTKGDLVKLNAALIRYGIDIAEKYGFTLMETPDLAKNSILQGIGFNPRGEETQIYSIENTDLSLIGTAEITMGGYHQDEILDLTSGPLKYVALSHCYRTEAGSYGRTSKGLYRVHQFTKLEMFVYCKPEDSEKIHQELLAIEREICDGLEIPYQVIDIATADLGGPAYRKFDIEAYMTMADGFGEITSTSNCTDYQANRLMIRYKDTDGKNKPVHTLNGTAIVTSRFPIAIFENHQQQDGSIKIPTVLIPYTGFAFITK